MGIMFVTYSLHDVLALVPKSWSSWIYIQISSTNLQPYFKRHMNSLLG